MEKENALLLQPEYMEESVANVLRRKKSKPPFQKYYDKHNESGSVRRYNSSSSNVKYSSCNKCGQSHRTKCPAEGVSCHKCGKFNHFAKMCFQTIKW